MSGGRIVVTRSPERDVVEWVKDKDSEGGGPESSPYRAVTPPPPSAGNVHVGSGKPPTVLIGTIIAIVVLGAAAIFLAPKDGPRIEAELSATIADLSPVHAGVTASGERVRELVRLVAGDTVETDAHGRARLRLDTGASLVIDGSTKLVVEGDAVRVEAGRVFLTGVKTPTKIDLGDGTISVVGAAVGVDRRSGGTKVYVASGEVVARAGGKEAPVRTGETATFGKGEVSIAPERGFDDWTGGLAAPWGASGPPRRAIGELWGRTRPGDVGSPLTVRTHDARATIHGEVAETRVTTTFFNAGDGTVAGDYRLAVPPDAIVSGFAVTRGENRKKGRLGLAKRGAEASLFAPSTGGDLLEWAGEGYVRGSLPGIPPGQTVTVEISYVEWLPVRARGDRHVVTYRYPLAGEAEAQPIGEFFARVDAGPARASRLAAGMGARSDEAVVELRRADFRPTADFVVDVEIPDALPAARAYVAPGKDDDDEPTIFVRTEAPRLEGAEEGVTLAIVLDASASVDPAHFAASRAFTESILGSLGPKDRAVVLAADSAVTAVGPEHAGPVDEARKKAILDGLAALTLGGATDLGRAFEAGANALPADAPSGMVVYVGDGWPSVGDRSAEAIRARLARRERGIPRLGAVLVGPSANRRSLAALVQGSGPVLEIGDSEDAARAAVSLLERALVPTVTGVAVDLGPKVIRVYPRGEGAAPQGGSIAFVGKLIGEAPAELTLTYRSGSETKREKRALSRRPTPSEPDVVRRWAAARAEAMALAGRGREAVTEAALGAELLTPWTAWTTQGDLEYVATSMMPRILDLAVHGEAGMVPAIDAPLALGSVPSELDADASAREGDLGLGLQLAAHRAIAGAMGQLRACRDSRAALRPDLPGAIEISFDLDGDGQAAKVTVTGAGDDAVARCVATVVENLGYPRVGEKVEVKIQHKVVWPPAPPLRGKKCSPTSLLDVPLRRGVWMERMREQGQPIEAFREAARGCEIATWTAKRAFLELAIADKSSLFVLSFADAVGLEGDLEAAASLRKEALRRARPHEMRAVRARLLASEVLPRAKLDERYAKATTDAARLEVVRTFLLVAPHNPLLRRRLLGLLASLGDADTLTDEVRRLRADPLADAVVLANAATALRRVGLEPEARRTFGEIAERASADPWALAFLGDRLRNEGWFDDATAAYRALEGIAPSDASTSLRLALAHAGAGRLDVAMRIAGRVARTGGRTGDASMATLADRAALFLARAALERPDISAADRTMLERATLEQGALPAGRTFFITFPAGGRRIGVVLERGADKARELVAAEAIAPAIGLATVTTPAGADQGATIVLSCDKPAAPPEAPGRATITTLEGGKIVAYEVELPAAPDTPVTVAWTGASFELKKK